MKKNKKLLLAIGTVATIVTPIATVVSCGSTSSNSKWNDVWAGDRRDLKELLATIGGQAPDGAKYDSDFVTPDATPRSPGPLNAGVEGTLIRGVRPVVLGNPIYDATGQIVSGTESVQWNKFDAWNKVTFVFAKIGTANDESEEIAFDSDESSKTNVRSINSDKFDGIIKGVSWPTGKYLKTLKFTFKKGVKWVKNGTGEETKYEVGPKDMFAEQTSSNSASGKLFVTELAAKDAPTADDQKAATDLGNKITDALGKVAESTGNMFNWHLSDKPWSQSLPTFYKQQGQPYDLKVGGFNKIDTKDFVDGQDAVYQFNQDSEGYKVAGFLGSFFQYLSDEHALSPLQYYEDRASDFDDLLKSEGKLSDDELAKFKTTTAYKTGYFVKQLFKRNEQLSAGAYYLEKADNKNAVYRANEHYADQNFVADKHRAKSLTYTYYDKDAEFARQQANAFEQGTTISVTQKSIQSLGEEYAAKIQKDQDGAGVRYLLDVDKTGNTGNGKLALPTTPILAGNEVENPKDDSEKNFYYYYDSNFCKLLFGKTQKEANEIDNDKAKSTEINKFTTLGKGFAFRSLLHESVNWYTHVRGQSHNAQQYYSSIFTPDFDVAAGHETKEVTAYGDGTGFGTDRHTFGIDGDKIKDLRKLTASDLQKAYSQGTSEGDQYETTTDDAQLQVLKDNFKNLLDAAGIKQGDKVTFEWQQESGSYQDSEERILRQQHILELIRGLDSRLNPVARVEPGTYNYISKAWTEPTVKFENFTDEGYNSLVKSSSYQGTGSDNSESYQIKQLTPSQHDAILWRLNEGYAARIATSMYHERTFLAASEMTLGGLVSQWFGRASDFSSGTNLLHLLSLLKSESTDDLPEVLKPIKAISESFEEEFKEWQKEFVSDANFAKEGLTDVDIINAIKGLKFEDFAGYSQKIANEYGLGEALMSAASTDPLPTSILEDQTKQSQVGIADEIITRIQYIWGATHLTKILDEKISSNADYTYENVAEALDEIYIEKQSFSAATNEGSIGNRQALPYSLTKSWLHTHQLQMGGSLLANYYIDEK